MRSTASDLMCAPAKQTRSLREGCGSCAARAASAAGSLACRFHQHNGADVVWSSPRTLQQRAAGGALQRSEADGAWAVGCCPLGLKDHIHRDVAQVAHAIEQYDRTLVLSKIVIDSCC